MQYELTDEYIAEARKRAYRYQGQWTGTAGSLAADVARLLIERKRMQGFITDLEDSNAQLRAAVENRLAGGCCDGGKCHTTDDAPDRWKEITQASAEKYNAERAEPEQEIPVDWILQGQKEMEAHGDDIRWAGDSIIADKSNVTPAEKLLMDALDVVRDRRPKYGGPRHHFKRTIGMINAAFADVLKRPLTESDWAIFMTFDKVARFLGPNKTADGPIDLAGYAACLAECESAEAV
ncbi:MAG: hypothetical protein EBR82_25225 [Caulobacteraceae bacterium]|nr:hypothetical protein [Caulobacteraceae bacterium]